MSGASAAQRQLGLSVPSQHTTRPSWQPHWPLWWEQQPRPDRRRGPCVGGVAHRVCGAVASPSAFSSPARASCALDSTSISVNNSANNSAHHDVLCMSTPRSYHCVTWPCRAVSSLGPPRASPVPHCAAGGSSCVLSFLYTLLAVQLIRPDHEALPFLCSSWLPECRCCLVARWYLRSIFLCTNSGPRVVPRSQPSVVGQGAKPYRYLLTDAATCS